MCCHAGRVVYQEREGLVNKWLADGVIIVQEQGKIKGQVRQTSMSSEMAASQGGLVEERRTLSGAKGSGEQNRLGK